MKKARMENFGRMTAAGISLADAEELQKLARLLGNADLADCNGYTAGGLEITESMAESRSKLEDRRMAHAQEIAAKYGRTAYHQSDPRGWSLYLVSPEEMGGCEIGSTYSRGLAVCSE